MREMIRRATDDFNVTGRTLEGVALFWDRPARVVDPGKQPYLEAFARGSATKSITEKGRFPVDWWHGTMSGTMGARSRWAGEVFGSTMFRATDDGLEFTATLSKTRGGDEMLELLNDGAAGDVSVAAWPVKSTNRAGVVLRTEIALAALSLAPVGAGQIPGAKVLAMRADGAQTPHLDDLRRRKALLVRP